MGAFYGSVYVKSDKIGAVKELLEGLATRNRKFLMAPSINGWVTIYPSDHGQDDRVSKLIAKKIDAPILQVAVHDDDVFFYSYYKDRKVVDRFNSCPDYFEPASKRMKNLLRGKPERLAKLLGRPEDIHKLETVLEEMRGRPLFVSRGFDSFAELLGLPHASTSYEYLMAGETDDIDEWDQFVHVPDLTEERKLEQEAAARVQREKDLLKEAGQLLCEVTVGKKSTSPPFHVIWCADAVNGLLMATSAFALQADVPIEQHAPPWNGEATATGITLSPQAIDLTTSSSGKYLAVGYGGQIQKAELWNLENHAIELAVAHTSVVHSLAFSSDERLLYSISWNEIIGTNIDTEQQNFEWKTDKGQGINLHPNGTLVALNKQDSASILNLNSGQERLIRLGRYQDLSGRREMLQSQFAKQMEEAGPDWMVQQAKQTMEQLEVPEDSVVGKRIRKEIEERMNDMLSGKAFEHMTERTFQPENFFSVIFAAGGKFVCCGTTAGIRVFETDSLLKSNEGDVDTSCGWPLARATNVFSGFWPRLRASAAAMMASERLILALQ